MKRSRFWKVTGIAVSIAAIVLLIAFARSCHTGSDAQANEIPAAQNQTEPGKDLPHRNTSV